MKKNDTDMSTTQSETSLTITRSDNFSIAGRLVVACGYTVGGQFGYFIVREAITSTPTVKEVYNYSDQVAFYPKKNENTFKEVIEHMKQLVS